MNEFELRLYASKMEVYDLKGLAEDIEKLEIVNKERFYSDMLNSGFMEINSNGKYFYTAYGQRIINILSNPTVWISVDNRLLNKKRIIYVKDLDYLYIDVDNKNTYIDILPVLPLAIGAYAQMLQGIKPGKITFDFGEDDLDQISDIIIKGTADVDLKINVLCKQEGNIAVFQKADVLEIKDTSEEECVNLITAWLLECLKNKEA